MAQPTLRSDVIGAYLPMKWVFVDGGRTDGRKAERRLMSGASMTYDDRPNLGISSRILGSLSDFQLISGVRAE